MYQLKPTVFNMMPFPCSIISVDKLWDTYPFALECSAFSVSSCIIVLGCLSAWCNLRNFGCNSYHVYVQEYGSAETKCGVCDNNGRGSKKLNKMTHM